MKAAALLCGLLALAGALAAQPGVVDFGAERWALDNAKVVDFMGRKALMGAAYLKDVEFDNGVIEVDIVATSERGRSYPGVLFRVQPNRSWERFYIRPHRHTLYGDVLQYVPAFNGVDSWQLYSGFGYTAPAVIPVNQWLHVKIEVLGSQARITLGNSDRPALLISELKHGLSKGSLGVMGPPDGSAYFSNFSYRADSSLKFEAMPLVETSPGALRDWQVSKSFKASAIDMRLAPAAQKLGDLAWRPLTAEPGGLVDVGRAWPRSNEPDAVFARTVIRSAAEESRRFDFGYSDMVSLFLNGKLLYSGDSRYQYRDSSFLGIVGYFDSLYLPLRKGDNELLLAVAEASGGWGFMVRDGSAVYAAEGVQKVWESAKGLSIPESAAHDPARDCLYVSNYDGYNRSVAEGKQTIAKLAMDGKIEKLDWVAGVKNPTGLVVVGDRLFAVERTGVVEIDIPQARIVTRHPAPGAGMLNDIAAAPDGALYVTDSARATIFKFAAGKAEEWLRGPQIARPNGIHVHGGKLYVGTNEDNCVKSVDLATKQIQVIANLGQGIIDGVLTDEAGNLLVSHNEGRLYRISPDGKVTKLLDLTVQGHNIADFDFIPARDLVVFPTFLDNRVMAYRLAGGAR